MSHHESNRWKGFVIGAVSSLAGLMAMRSYWQRAAPKVKENVDLGGKQAYPDEADLNDIALVGRQYQGEESSTAALGRIIYHAIAGKDPQTQETKELMSYLVHWGYGMVQGGVYGAMRAGDGRGLDLAGGALFAAGLWLMGDEMAVPMLGLQSGPTAVAPVSHVNRLGAHLTYGVTTAVTTQLLGKLL